MIRSAVAIAPSNIALIKYWGKRDTKLNLACNSSISMTLDNSASTTTKVTFSEEFKADELILNGKNEFGKKLERVKKHLDLIRSQVKNKKLRGLYAKVESTNSFPSGTGIASSASGFCALTLAACKALELEISTKELSIIARRGSGSAARSFGSGFVVWHKGDRTDGKDSFSESFLPKEHWNELVDIITIVSSEEKKVGSREGMQQTVKTSRLFKERLKTIDTKLEEIKQAIRKKDRERFFTLIMQDSDEMHATMRDTSPPLDYLNSTSHKIIDFVRKINISHKKKICAYTFDAGPNAHIITTKEYARIIIKKLSRIPGVKKTILCKIGSGASVKNTSVATVKAFGKILVFGGYGILEGGPGLVVNINKGTTAIARFREDNKILLTIPKDRGKPADFRFVKSAVDCARKYLMANRIIANKKQTKGLEIRTFNDLEMNPKSVGKTGFGSSATATVSIVAAILDLYGIDTTSKKGRETVFSISQKAHNNAQGKIGSGFDISATCFGTQIFAKKKILGKVLFPEDWESILAFSGKSASTTELVKGIIEYKKKHPAEYKKIMHEYNSINFELAKLFLKRNSANKRTVDKEIIQLLKESYKLRKSLGKQARVQIESDKQSTLLSEIEKYGAVFATLPGAGGGDSVLTVCKNSIDTERVKQMLKKMKLFVLDVEISDIPYIRIQ